jgi:hypothetical protein
VDRIYIACHAVPKNDLPALAARFGWAELSPETP